MTITPLEAVVEPALFLVNHSAINVRGMDLTGVSRNMITVWIATTVFCSADLMMLSARTVMFPKDVIEFLSKDQEINADPERRNA
jgi:hypothetical protein